MEIDDNCFLNYGVGVPPPPPISLSSSLAISIHCMGCQMSDSLYIVAYTF